MNKILVIDDESWLREMIRLALEQHGQTPTHWQHTRYPDWAQRKIDVIMEGARLDLCRPAPALHKALMRSGPWLKTAQSAPICQVITRRAGGSQATTAPVEVSVPS